MFYILFYTVFQKLANFGDFLANFDNS